jgi:hypothetical protein
MGNGGLSFLEGKAAGDVKLTTHFQLVPKARYTTWIYTFTLPGIQLLREGEIVAVIFCYLFSSELPTLLKFPILCFLSVFLSFTATFCFANPVGVQPGRHAT